MPKTVLNIGETLDMVNKQELHDTLLDAQAVFLERQEAAAVRGIKYFRLPFMYATPSGSAVTLGLTQPTAGPAQGFAWSIRRLAAGGLTTGGSPDVLNIYRNGTATPVVWQLNGNNFAYTFGKMELILLPGETLIANGTAITATGQITLSGDAVEVPAEMLGKLAF